MNKENKFSLFKKNLKSSLKNSSKNSLKNSPIAAFGLLFGLMFLLVIAGCLPTAPTELTDLESVTVASDELRISYAEGDSSAKVTADLTLPTNVGNDGVSVSWVSSHEAIINNDGTVTLPVAITDVTLTATLTKGSASDRKAFTVTVQAISDTDAVAAAKAALLIAYIPGDSSTNVTTDLTLPTNGSNGVAITWFSSETSIIATNGVVIRQSASADVTLTATLTKGSVSDTKAFPVTVIGIPDTEAVASAKTALALTYTAGDDSNSVTADVTLPTSGANGVTITWTSGDTSIIATNGTVTRPNASTDVILTATLTKNAAMDTKIFTVTAVEHLAPIIANQSFTALDNISDTEVIDRVVASDPEGQPLSYVITTNDNDLFEIDASSGDLSLATGQSLDLATDSQHTITVSVGDGGKSNTAIITIVVSSFAGYGYDSLDLLAISDSGLSDSDNHTSNENLSFSLNLWSLSSNAGGDIFSNAHTLTGGQQLLFFFSNTVSAAVTNYLPTLTSGNYNITNVAEANYDDFDVSLYLVDNTETNSLTGDSLTVKVDRTIGSMVAQNLDTNFFTMGDVLLSGTQQKGFGGITFINTNGTTIEVGDIIGFKFHFIEPFDITTNSASSIQVHQTNILSISGVIPLPNYQFVDDNRSLEVLFQAIGSLSISSLYLIGIWADNAGNNVIQIDNSSVSSFEFNRILPSSNTYP